MSALIIGENKTAEKLSAELKIKIWDSEKNEFIKPWLSGISYGKNKDRAYGETEINSKTYELTKVNAGGGRI